MNILVTGSSGWLAQDLMPRLKRAEHTVIGLGSVFIHLRASINWHQLFESLIDGFDVDALTERQDAALKIAGLTP